MAVWDPNTDTHATVSQSDDKSSRGPAVSPTEVPDRGRLVAFVQGKFAPKVDSGVNFRLLRRKLAGSLSAAELPSLFLPVQKTFPLTTSGKVSSTLERLLVSQ